MPSSRGSSQPRDRTQVSCIADGFLTAREYVYIHATLLLLGEASLGSPLTTPVSTTPGRYGYIIPTLVGIILPEHPPVSSQP